VCPDALDVETAQLAGTTQAAGGAAVVAVVVWGGAPTRSLVVGGAVTVGAWWTDRPTPTRVGPTWADGGRRLTTEAAGVDGALGTRSDARAAGVRLGVVAVPVDAAGQCQHAGRPPW
jgi:hypothetical protein